MQTWIRIQQQWNLRNKIAIKNLIPYFPNDPFCTSVADPDSLDPDPDPAFKWIRIRIQDFDD